MHRARRPARVQRYQGAEGAFLRPEGERRQDRGADRARDRHAHGARADPREQVAGRRHDAASGRRVRRDGRRARRAVLHAALPRAVPRPDRTVRPPAAAAVYRARSRCDRRDALPDRLCEQPGRGRRADGRAPFRPAAAGAARRAGRRARDAHAARRRRHVPAGARRQHRRAQDAQRVVRPAAVARRQDRRDPRARRQRDRGRHDVDARARSRGALGRRSRPPARGDAGRNRHLHHARLPFPRGRPARDELPPAEIDAADAGVRVRGRRDDPRRVPARDRRTLSVLQLRRRDAAHAARHAGGAGRVSSAGGSSAWCVTRFFTAAGLPGGVSNMRRTVFR
ncbi:hypothetical protein F01_350013 [Burkholderia cenocepacia]|nr:hypothetical protein F01_350013 [Burkholderia cenocepacia]